MIPEFLVTHSGGFHADELLSSVILTRLFPQARIVRSRAPEWITPGPDRIIYDVGGLYDADRTDLRSSPARRPAARRWPALQLVRLDLEALWP